MNTTAQTRRLRRLIPQLASQLQTPGADANSVARRLAIALRDYSALDPAAHAPYVALHRHHLLTELTIIDNLNHI